MQKTGLWIVGIIVVLVGGFIWWQSAQTVPSTTDVSSTLETGVSTEVSPADVASSPSAQPTSQPTSQPATPPVSQPATKPASQPSSGTTVPGPKVYAMAEVAVHKDSTSCWSAIDGKVYDLTSWITKHPGGRQAIVGLCGKDGTEKFHGQHGDNKQQADALASMIIGTLQ